jgi:sigma-E factor negative regulatory protein RseA
MTEAHRENLSAGIDGELTRDELRFLLRQLEHDVDLREVWTRYHVAQDGLRKQLPPLASVNFAARVMHAIEVPVAAGAARRGHWLRWSAGGAIAASVAVAALMVTQPTADTGRAVATGVVASADHSVASSSLPASQPTAPAAVPPWLSGSNASLYSQQASATLDGYGDGTLPYAHHLARYQVQRPAKINPDGGYLLLIDPPAVPSVSAPSASPQAAAIAQ